MITIRRETNRLGRALGRLFRVTSSATEAPQPELVSEDRLRTMMAQAMSRPTPEAIMSFVAFASRMKRMGPYNIWMVFAQRPGARAIASKQDWERAGKTICADAIPILILKPRGPITQVYEEADTLPRLPLDPAHDPLGASGAFDDLYLERLKLALAAHTKRKLRVIVVNEDFGADLAGTIASYGMFESARETGGPLGVHDPRAATKSLPERGQWRVKLNKRLSPVEQFATLLHELGHLFCGHLGAFDADNPEADEFGWPDRRYLPFTAQEIEAELVAWHVCERQGIVTGSPLYLQEYMRRDADAVGQVDLERVIRAIARACAYLRGTPLRQAKARHAKVQ